VTDKTAKAKRELRAMLRSIISDKEHVEKRLSDGRLVTFDIREPRKTPKRNGRS
jgi:hypothetical protein